MVREGDGVFVCVRATDLGMLSSSGYIWNAGVFPHVGQGKIIQEGVVLGSFHCSSPSCFARSESLCTRECPGGKIRKADGGLNLIHLHRCIPNTHSLPPRCDPGPRVHIHLQYL